ncbi:MAG: proline dehydrogenase family protein [Saprospiraceae bacterium]
MEQINQVLKKANPKPIQKIDFTNTEIAFSSKTNKELIKMKRLFALMNKPLLVKWGSKLGLLAFKLRLPFAKSIVKNTIFEHFCGGINLIDCQSKIDTLYNNNSLTILDYGAEGKSSEEDLQNVVVQTIMAIEFAASNTFVPVVSTKVTGIADNDLLIKIQANQTLNEKEEKEYKTLLNRFDKICSKASELGVGVFVDAEESWLQGTIDDLVMDMMIKYNKEKVIVYNTYQLYRHSKLAELKSDHEKLKKEGSLLGAKLVRGAYMDKERLRAIEMDYKSPIQLDKAATDIDFDSAVTYCITNHETIASCCASHNVKSNMHQAKLIHDKGLAKDNPNFNFCQLYGMGDYITYNIGKAGYNVAKYLPYGPIRDVVPYLIRRARENSSVTGEMSRELALIKSEIKRRKI